MPKLIKPAYLLHKATGQACCRIDRKDHYLSRYGSPESCEKYDELVAEWFARNGDTSRRDLTVDDLAIFFLEFAEKYYQRENGESTGEATHGGELRFESVCLCRPPLVLLFWAG